MASKKDEFQNENYQLNGLDNSQTNYKAENLQSNNHKKEATTMKSLEESINDHLQPEFVEVKEAQGSTRPYRRNTHLGGYISRDSLQKILKKKKKDRGFFQVFDSIRKSDRQEINFRRDFDLLRDFFPSDLVSEVEDFCLRLLPKVQERVGKDKGLKNLTPRNRRGIILAVFRSVCRRNGRNFTKELLEEINDRFGYQRRIKLFEVSSWESDLINYKLLARPAKSDRNKLRRFFLHVVKHLNHLEKDPVIAKNEDYLSILTKARKHLLSFSSSAERRASLAQICLHKDIDFLSRLIIWTLVRNYALEEFSLTFRSPEKLAGWSSLFLVDSDSEGDSSAVPIRSWKYIFWSEFSLRKELKAEGLFPPSSEPAS